MAAPWARVLNGVPGSRLVLKDHTLGDEAVGAYYLDLFARHGLAPERIHYEGKAPYTEYLDAYNRIDVALDPFRLNGGMTTVESLWMGVPVVTLAGDHCSARMGVSHLTAVGLEELIAASPDDYVAMAVALATDGPRLAELRATLRERLRAGLCDAPAVHAGPGSRLPRDVAPPVRRPDHGRGGRRVAVRGRIAAQGPGAWPSPNFILRMRRRSLDRRIVTGWMQSVTGLWSVCYTARRLRHPTPVERRPPPALPAE